jgi:AraC-like DNA-binding protein
MRTSCLAPYRAHRQSVRNASVSVSGPAAIPAVLRRLGHDPTAILVEAGLDPTLFDDTDNLIRLSGLGHLMTLCVARTGCEEFGLLVGQQGGLHSLGLVGLLARYAPDVSTALRRLGEYMYLHHGGTLTTVKAEGDTATLSYAIHQPSVESTDQIGDGSTAVLFNIVRELCGPDWRPIEVHFARGKPGNLDPYQAFFGAPLRFGTGENAIVFSSVWLGRRLPELDAELQRLLKKKIEDIEARHSDSFPDQVRGVLRAALLAQRASADEVAALFSMHSRTLNRRLHEFNTNFRELVDEGRYEIARQMLANSSLDVTEVAFALGYADASAFTRAFRRWSRTTPAAWRAQRRSGSNVGGDQLCKPVNPVLDSARAAPILESKK